MVLQVQALDAEVAQGRLALPPQVLRAAVGNPGARPARIWPPLVATTTRARTAAGS